MRVFDLFAAVAVAAGVVALRTTTSTSGVESLVRRRLPQHAESFQFEIVETLGVDGTQTEIQSELVNDSYVVSSASNGKVIVQGNTVGALLAG